MFPIHKQPSFLQQMVKLQTDKVPLQIRSHPSLLLCTSIFMSFSLYTQTDINKHTCTAMTDLIHVLSLNTLSEFLKITQHSNSAINQLKAAKKGQEEETEDRS